MHYAYYAYSIGAPIKYKYIKYKYALHRFFTARRTFNAHA